MIRVEINEIVENSKEKSMKPKRDYLKILVNLTNL